MPAPTPIRLRRRGHVVFRIDLRLSRTQGSRPTRSRLCSEQARAGDSDLVPYVIRQGDHLTKLAARFDFDMEAVWNDAENADLRKLRGDPHILCAGDVIYLPEPKPRKWLPVSVGVVNRFVAEVPTTKITLQLKQNGDAIGGAKCVLHELAPPNEVTTDGSGTLVFDAPAHLEFVTLEIPSLSLVRRFRIGHLDPSSEPSGILQRLRNLGYVSPAGQALGEERALALALTAFQRAQGLAVTGTIDDETSKRLADAHGC